MVADRIERYFTEAEFPILFAGAGVSRRAGLPTWWSYLSDVAAQVDVYDTLTRQMMQKQLALHQYDMAAEYFFLSNQIPEGRKYEMLITPLQEYSDDPIKALVALPFRAIVTTNFDRSLLDAYSAAHGRAARQVEVFDPSLKTAPFLDEFYIARVHGRVEAPETIVLSASKFKDLLALDSYRNFLTYIATRTQLCFLGFSFVDPAINCVLNLIRDTVGTMHKGNHLAFLPKDASVDLSATLNKLNIEVVLYDHAKDHAVLWKGIATTSKRLPSIDDKDITAPRPFEYAQKYMAAAYSRSKLGPTNKPLRLAILEGVVAQELRESGDKGLTSDELTNIVHEKLRVSWNDSQEIVMVAIDRLHRDSLCEFSGSDGSRYLWNTGRSTKIEDPIDPLVDGIMDRFVVRGGGSDSEIFRQCVRASLNALFLRRGWDLGAAFASGRIPDTLELDDLDRSLSSCEQVNTLSARRLYEAISDILKSPTSWQSVVLSQIGRLSFGLELVLQSPQDALFHALTLPEVIYLDANVLMPAIVKGHPYNEVYSNTLERLQAASAEALIQVEVIAYRGFLNEVISHRRLAIEEYDELDEPYMETLRKDVLLYGSANLNVFLSGYANRLKIEPSLTFEKFLEQYAPYENEESLERYLGKNGILVRREGELIGEGDAFPKILHHLEIAFADAIAKKQRTSLLVRHDAVQLAGLYQDCLRGKKSIVVTADGKLRDAVSQSKWSNLGNAMVSHVGLIQLIDILVGVDVEARGFATMMFFPKVSNRAEQIRQYLVSRALDSYDDAMAMEMHSLVDRYTEEIEDQFPTQDPEEPEHVQRARVRRVMDGFEDQYFAEMRKLIEKTRSNRPEE